MEKNQEQKDFLMMWVANKLIPEAMTKNIFKKESIRTFNKVLVQMTTFFCNEDILPEEVISEFIQNEFFSSRYTASKYIKKIIAKGVFKYNPTNATFLLPDDVVNTLKSKAQEN